MIWTKTDAGRLEMQTRALVKERARRNLLLLIDGQKSEEMLLVGLAGIGPEDFRSLEALGLIVPLSGARRSAGGAVSAAGTGAAAMTSTSTPPPNAGVTSPPVANPAVPATPSPSSGLAASESVSAPTPLDYGQFTAALTQLISSHLGLRGFVLTLAVERAGTIEELQGVAQRVLDQIRDRRGDAAASAARQTLYGV